MLADKPILDLEAVVTFDRIDGFDVLANLGIVCGEAVLPRALLLDPAPGPSAATFR